MLRRILSAPALPAAAFVNDRILRMLRIANQRRRERETLHEPIAHRALERNEKHEPQGLESLLLRANHFDRRLSTIADNRDDFSSGV
jgi:hypothetical protein